MTTKIEYSVVFSVIGSFVFYFLGGADTLLKVMVSLILLDYLTGFTKAIMTTGLNSNKGLKGILRKTMYLSAIILSVLLDKVTHLNEAGLSFRTIMLLYMIGTEGISILENLSITYEKALQHNKWDFSFLEYFLTTLIFSIFCI